MKRCNKITVIWTCAIVVVALFWGVALYNNARKGQTVVKEVALQTLQKVDGNDDCRSSDACRA